jgi:hypothetical protein
MVPMFINSVHPPYVPASDNSRSLGIDVQHDYDATLDAISRHVRRDGISNQFITLVSMCLTSLALTRTCA